MFRGCPARVPVKLPFSIRFPVVNNKKSLGHWPTDACLFRRVSQVHQAGVPGLFLKFMAFSLPSDRTFSEPFLESRVFSYNWGTKIQPEVFLTEAFLNPPWSHGYPRLRVMDERTKCLSFPGSRGLNRSFCRLPGYPRGRLPDIRP